VAKHAAVALRRILVVEEAMQERGVRRIDADLERLQPVAVDQTLEREGVRLRGDEAVEVRKRWRRARILSTRPEIGEQDAAPLDHGIGLLLDVGAEVRAVGLSRRLQALAADVEQPAMEGAAQPVALQPAVCQIGAAMRAGAAEKPVA